MVLIHLKKNDQSVLLAQVPASTPTNVVIETLVKLCNTILRIERLCMAMEDLAKYGIYKPFDQHGYQPEDLDKFINQPGDSQEQINEPKTGTIFIQDGQQYIHNPDPTGRRNGLAPIPSIAETITTTITDALQAIHRNQVMAKVIMTETKLNEILDQLRACITIAYPMGIPEFDPVSEILADTDDLSEAINGKDILDPSTSTLWWAGKELRGKVLSDYVSNNDKTTIIAKLQKRGSGAPMREPPLSEQAQKEMMAYYYRKQEELKKLDDDDDETYVYSPWANPKSLKTSFQGLSKGGITWRPR